MIDNDDLLYRIDGHYLGPAGHTLPFRVRYAALRVGAPLFVVLFLLARAVVHVPLGFKSMAVLVVITAILTVRTVRHVNADRPVSSIFRAAWNDLVAPRPPKPGQTVTALIPRPPRSNTADSADTADTAPPSFDKDVR